MELDTWVRILLAEVEHFVAVAVMLNDSAKSDSRHILRGYPRMRRLSRSVGRVRERARARERSVHLMKKLFYIFKTIPVESCDAFAGHAHSIIISGDVRQIEVVFAILGVGGHAQSSVLK